MACLRDRPTCMLLQRCRGAEPVLCALCSVLPLQCLRAKAAQEERTGGGRRGRGQRGQHARQAQSAGGQRLKFYGSHRPQELRLCK